MARSRTFQKIYGANKTQDQPLDVTCDRLDLLRCRIGLLTGKDLALMRIYLENAGTFRQMAQLAGVNEANIARRIYKLVRRLLDGQYITCLRNRDKFTQEQIEIARDYFVDGLPVSEIVWRREISRYRVKGTLRKIQRLTYVPNTAAREG